MAKVTVKKSTPALAKKAVATRAKAKASSVTIDKACGQALEKLKALNVEQQLQADIAWCIGSFGYDQNPIGLYQIGAKALEVLTKIKTTNAKSVPAKVITDLKNALKKA